MPELLPKVELYLGIKTFLLIPLFFLGLLSSLWGFRLWRQARAGYRPTGFDSTLQQPLYMTPGHTLGPVQQPVMFAPQ